MRAETKDQIISALDPREPRGTAEVAQRSGLSPNHAGRLLAELEEAGCVVETTGYTRNRAWTRKRTKSETAEDRKRSASKREASSAARAAREVGEAIRRKQVGETSEDALEAIALRAFARLDPETRQRFLERAIDEL